LAAAFGGGEETHNKRPVAKERKSKTTASSRGGKRVEKQQIKDREVREKQLTLSRGGREKKNSKSRMGREREKKAYSREEKDKI